jgi:predicted acetyltransferase
VTGVAVVSTDRRQGHLSRLMTAELAQVVDQGLPVAALIAAEWPIYGRFGYGAATHACGYRIDGPSAAFRAPPTGSVRLVDSEELRPALQAVHEARWSRTPGALTFPDEHWDRHAGLASWPNHPLEPGKLRSALWHDDDGVLGGAVTYKVQDAWTDNRPSGTVEVQLLFGVTPTAERELWRHLCQVDWTTTVQAGNRGLDDPLPYFVEDGRSVVPFDRSDSVWLRILDVPSAIAARRSAIAGAAVAEVVDDVGHANGRWAIEIGPDGAAAAKTTESADVQLPASALGAAYLGGTPLQRLAEAGWVDELRPGGVDRLGALLAAPVAPWSPIGF